MTRTMLRVLAAAALAMAIGVAPVAAQTGQMFGELVGKITDDQGGVLPGVTVTLSGPAVMGSPTATTNAQGLYRFPAVNSGTYTLKFELTGFSPLTREGIVVPVRQTITVDSIMKVAALQETVTVTGVSPTVDVENTKVGARLDNETLTSVPTSRTIFGATTVLPGMVMGRQDPGGLNAATSTGMAAHGTSGYNLNYYGVTADTPQNYGSMYYMDFGSAEEVSVDTAAMGAEIGGGGGANINVVPKSGGNSLKAQVIDSFTGKGYWDKFTASNITPELRAQGINDPTLRNLNDFNANAGGPFLKDRMWWFGSYRDYRTTEATPGYTVVNEDGSLTNPFFSQLKNYTASTKYQINKNNQLSGFWTYNKKFQPHRGAGVTQPRPEGTLNQQSPKHLFNGNWTSVFGQNTFLEVSSSYFHMHWPSDFSEEFYAQGSAQRPSTFNITTGIYIDGPEPTGQRLRDSYRQQTNIGVTRYIDGFLGASHQLKTGFENWWTPTGTDEFNIFQDVRLRYTGATNCTATVRTGCVANEVFLYNTPLVQKTQMKNYAAFVQDRLSYQRFTFNLGVRFSHYDGTIPAQSNGGAQWGAACAACNQSFPEIKAPFSWNTVAPRTGVVWKVTEDGKNVVKASYSRYYEVMYTGEFSSINGNSINTGGVATYAWAGAFDAAGRPVLGAIKSQFVARSNSIDPDLKNPKNDEIMFAYQREVANNVSFNVDWIQRWFNDQTVDQNCYGLPCSQAASTAWLQNRTAADFGPDNITGTADDRALTVFQVAPAFLGRDTFFHTNCGNNVSVDCTQRYKALEISLGKRMSNRWQMQGSYVWSKLDGDLVLDYTNPNNLLEFVGQGRGDIDQPHAFKLLGSYQAPYGVTLGANFQSLSGLPRDRVLSVAFSQGTANLRMEPRGTYRADTLNLLSVRADKMFRFSGGHRAGIIAEIHNLANSHAGQSNYGTVTRGNASQAAFEAARLGTSYFGRVQEIIAPRVLKIALKLDF